MGGFKIKKVVSSGVSQILHIPACKRMDYDYVSMKVNVQVRSAPFLATSFYQGTLLIKNGTARQLVLLPNVIIENATKIDIKVGTPENK